MTHVDVTLTLRLRVVVVRTVVQYFAQFRISLFGIGCFKNKKIKSR